jgi:16S rRNA (guanine966-N2)-methyltransferase
VIAGKYRSRTLRSLNGQELRPTSDRLRETLFNILGESVMDSVFVDLYAGTGAVGIEALSRGARKAIFVEKHKSAVAIIRQNLESLGIADEAEVLPIETLPGLKRLEARSLAADFVYLDPPYDAESEYGRVLGFVAGSRLLTAGGKVIAEHSRKFKLAERIGALELTRTLGQGDSTLSFYRIALAAS